MNFVSNSSEFYINFIWISYELVVSFTRNLHRWTREFAQEDTCKLHINCIWNSYKLHGFVWISYEFHIHSKVIVNYIMQIQLYFIWAAYEEHMKLSCNLYEVHMKFIRILHEFYVQRFDVDCFILGVYSQQQLTYGYRLQYCWFPTWPNGFIDFYVVANLLVTCKHDDLAISPPWICLQFVDDFFWFPATECYHFGVDMELFVKVV